MILLISLDSSYFSASNARSCVGRFWFLGKTLDLTKLLAQQRTFINTPLYAESSILRNIMGVASEAEIAGGYVNTYEGIELCVILIEMVHS